MLSNASLDADRDLQGRKYIRRMQITIIEARKRRCMRVCASDWVQVRCRLSLVQTMRNVT